jgi:hypothetical protein
LYRWTGSAWVLTIAASDAGDLTGQITGTQISDNAITAPKISANTITGNKIQANTITGGLLSTAGIITSAAQINDGLITNAKIGNAAITTAKISDGQVTNAKIGNTIQSTNYSAGSSGWSINKNGSAEFNGVVISRQLLVDSGTLNVGTFSLTPVSFGFTQSAFQYVESSNVSISAWGGSQKTFLCNVGVSGSISAPSSAVPNVYWGWTGEVLPLTRWSGNQTLRLKLVFWTRNVNNVTNLKAHWKIYEVT